MRSWYELQSEYDCIECGPFLYVNPIPSEPWTTWIMLEKEIQKEANKYLRELGILYIHIPQIQNRKRGVSELSDIPDLLFWVNGKSYAVELKAEKGKLRPGQEKWLDRFKDAGHEYFVIRSVEAFKELVNGLR